MDILPYGENGLRLVFGTEITVETNRYIRKVHSYLRSLGLKGIVEHVPCFTSYLIIFDPTVTCFQDLALLLRDRVVSADGRQALARAELPEPRVLELPVVYGGPDLEFVCSYSGLTREEVIEVHTGSVYTVFAVGFLPGFPYLGPLDRRLFTPRLDTPRVKVPEGSVGIAQLQTGVYSFESPGGWQIIGRTNTKLFDYTRPPYSLLQMGDQVRFVRA